MKFKRAFLCLWGVAVAGSPALAGLHCTAESADGPIQRIELYTSEGCSSCPAADRWLGELQAGPRVLPLAFHVDYWDQLGWPDRFADRRFSVRQREQARRSGSGAVYTPGVTLEGREWRSWSSGLPRPGSTATAALALDARLTDDHVLAVSLSSTSNWPDGARAYLAVTQSGLSTAVEAGENSGRALAHQHVVRAFAEGQPNDPIRLQLPAEVDPRQSALVAWIEEQATGRTWSAVRLPLTACSTSN